jgi:hypothetical protein
VEIAGFMKVLDEFPVGGHARSVVKSSADCH